MGLLQGPPRAAESDEEVSQAIRALYERFAQLETKVEHLGGEPRTPPLSDDKLAAIATSFYRSRQLRSALFQSELLGEPAWDMLLDLFIHKVQGRRVPTTSLCLAANTPVATGLRWIAALEREKLVHRSTSAADGRSKLIEMTPNGFQLMRRFIAHTVSRFQMPSPN
jgi:DNA-binding MarR family transcriptional regulator